MAVFSSLSDRLQDTFDSLRGEGRLTEDDINVAMREIRMALLEADVNYRVVKGFVGRCKEKCLGADVLDSLSPAQNVVRIVLDELTVLLGSTDSKLTLAQNRTPNACRVRARPPPRPSSPTCSSPRATARFSPRATRIARPQPTSSPPSAARSASRSSAATARTPWPWPRGPSARRSTT